MPAGSRAGDHQDPPGSGWCRIPRPTGVPAVGLPASPGHASAGPAGAACFLVRVTAPISAGAADGLWNWSQGWSGGSRWPQRCRGSPTHNHAASVGLTDLARMGWETATRIADVPPGTALPIRRLALHSPVPGGSCRRSSVPQMGADTCLAGFGMLTGEGRLATAGAGVLGMDHGSARGDSRRWGTGNADTWASGPWIALGWEPATGS